MDYHSIRARARTLTSTIYKIIGCDNVTCIEKDKMKIENSYYSFKIKQ